MADSNGAPVNGASPSDLIPIGVACELLGVCIETVRNYTRRGLLTEYRTPGGHRRFSKMAIAKLNGEDTDSEIPVVFYARCSTPKQAESLKSQIVRLRDYCEANYPARKIVELSDNATGATSNRKGFLKLIRMIIAGELDNSTIISEFADRIGRMNLDLFNLLCAEKNISIVYTQQAPEKTDSEILQDELLSILFIYSVKQYAKRNSARKSKPLSVEIVEFGREKLALGLSGVRLQKLFADNGTTNDDGTPISYNQIQKYIALSGKLTLIQPPAKNSVELFAETFIVASQNHRVLVSEAFAAYQKFCQRKGLLCLSKFKFCNALHRNSKSTWFVENGKKTNKRTYAGVIVPGCKTIMVKDYRQSETDTDSFLRFLDKQKNFRGKRTEFYTLYGDFCLSEKVQPIAKTKINSVLRQLEWRIYIENGIWHLSRGGNGINLEPINKHARVHI